MPKKRKPKPVESAAMPMDDAWRAEDDLRTIQRAHEVVSDKGRLSAAQSHAKRQRESLDRITRLKDRKL